MSLKGRSIQVHDMTLRDGMHPKRHLMSLDQMRNIAQGLDEAGVPLIEVTHGDGLGGSSVNYGFPSHTDEEYLSTVIPLMKQAKVSALLIPGIGTVDHLKMAHDLGVHTIRVATHCTEADVSEQHITAARKLNMDTVGFLMMAHMNTPEGLVSQAKLMEGYGANCIYVTDSAGYMLPEDVTPRIEAVRAALKPETELGFHGHHNLAMGVANSVAAVRAGANRIDAAAAGNFCAVLTARWAPVQATRRWKSSSPCVTAWALKLVWMCSRSKTWPKTAWCRSWTTSSASTATPSPWVMQVSIPASCCLPNAPRKNLVSQRVKFWLSWAAAAWSVVKKT